MIKTCSRLEIKENYLNMVKTVYKKHTMNIILNSKKTYSFSSKIRNKARKHTLTTSIQYSTKSSDQSY